MVVAERTACLREQPTSKQDDPAWLPDFTFTKPEASVLRLNSGGVVDAPMGTGWCFLTFTKAFLQGKNIKIRWRGYRDSGEIRNYAWILVMDGAYERDSMTDFPTPRVDPDYCAIKGAGQLYSYMKGSAHWFNWEEVSFTPNLDPSTEEHVTIMIKNADIWQADYIWVDIDYIRIYDGVDLVFSTEMDETPTIEQTGTHDDHGYIGILTELEIAVTTLLHIKAIQEYPGDAGGYYILGIWMRRMRARLDKIKADDHNRPRAILRKARDIIEERLF